MVLIVKVVIHINTLKHSHFFNKLKSCQQKKNQQILVPLLYHDIKDGCNNDLIPFFSTCTFADGKDLIKKMSSGWRTK